MVTRLWQDSRGFIWIGTDFGLSKFDGYEFTNYYHDKHDSTSMADNLIRTMLVTRRGELYIGCAKGLMRYDYASDRFHNFRFPDGVQPRVNALAENENGDLLIGTAGYGMYLLPAPDHSSSSASKKSAGGGCIRKAEKFAEMADLTFFNYLHFDGGGFLWVNGNDGRLLRLALTESTPVDVETFETGCKNLKSVLPIDGNLVFFFENGIREYDPYTQRLTESHIRLPKGFTLSSALMDSRGNLLVGSFYDLVVDCIMEDKDRNLWMACPHSGVFLSSADESPFRSVEVISGGKRLSQGFSFIVPAADGDGVYCLERIAGVFHVNRQGRVAACGHLPEDIRALFRDRAGQYWMSSAGFWPPSKQPPSKQPPLNPPKNSPPYIPPKGGLI